MTDGVGDSPADDVRIAFNRLEVVVQGLERNIAHLAEGTEKQMRDIASNFDRRIREFVTATEATQDQIARSVDALAKKQQENIRTPWANIIAFSGLFVTVLSIIGVGFVFNPMQRITKQTEQLSSEIEANASDVHAHVGDGHPGSVRATLDQAFRAAASLDDRTRSVLDDYGDKITSIEQWRSGWVEKSLPVRASLQERVSTIQSVQTDLKEGLSEVSNFMNRSLERLLALERDAYPGVRYRSGRPTRTAVDSAAE